MTKEVEDFFGKKTRHQVRAIGPFQEEISAGYGNFRTGHYMLEGSFYYAKVPFSAARNTLKKRIDEKRIVPNWLIDEIQNFDQLRHVASSMELIESKYEQRDAHGLISESNTLLASVLNLDPELSSMKSIGGQLNALIDSEAKREDFGVSQDLLRGLNSGRLIRNGKVAHKNLSIKYELPFLVAVSFAYLVIFFVESAILRGKLIPGSNPN